MADVEERIRELHRGGRLDEAIALTVESYGEEVFGFLASRMREEDLAADAFAQACEDLCVSLRTFEWRCSMRTWMYKLARSAAAKEARDANRRLRRGERLSEISELADRVSSRTRDYLRTEVKDGFAELRATLAPEDQTLLILRVDRRLDWLEVVEILSDDELGADDATKAAARLRQRFKKLKEELRRKAREAGLIGDEEDTA